MEMVRELELDERTYALALVHKSAQEPEQYVLFLFEALEKQENIIKIGASGPASN